jgi:hypothetical protein
MYLYAAEPFLRSHYLGSYLSISQHFMDFQGSLPCSQQPFTAPYPEPDQSRPSSLSNNNNLWLLLDAKMKYLAYFLNIENIADVCIIKNSIQNFRILNNVTYKG